MVDARWTPEERLAATAPWTEEERTAWRPREALSVSQWADRYRILAGDGVIEEGAWSTSRTPYLREIMDCLGAGSPYEEVVLMKSARVGGTEVGNNAISYWADLQPDPILLVFPDEKKADEEIRDRVEPMLKASPRTKALISDRAWDIKNRRIKLTSCLIRVAWSRSATSLGGFQARFVVFDETDKYGTPRNEADPISLGEARAMQYGERRRFFKLSTPTTRHGFIASAFESCPDRRRFWVPCPHCGERQVLRFERLRFEHAEDWKQLTPEQKRELAGRIETGLSPVTYACESCGAELGDVEINEAVRGGRWRSEGFDFGEHPTSKKVAFHVWAIYSPWVRLCEIAAQALASHAKGPKAYQNFVNSWLGEVYEEEQTSISRELISSRRAIYPLHTAPLWARAVVGGVDTQQDHLWFVARAFGSGGLSRLLDWGRVETWDELREQLLYRRWPIESSDLEIPTRITALDIGGGQRASPLIGNRTDEAYRFVASESGRVLAVKGRGGDFLPHEAEPIAPAKSGKGRLHGVETTLVNTQHFKTQVAGRIRADEPQLWEDGPTANEEYWRQMTAEHQVWKHRAGGVSYLWWQPRSGSAANHVWDATIYAHAAADILRVDLMQTMQQQVQQHQVRAREEVVEEEEREEGGWIQRDPSKPWVSGWGGRRGW